jgi:hypothetical protein
VLAAGGRVPPAEPVLPVAPAGDPEGAVEPAPAAAPVELPPAAAPVELAPAAAPVELAPVAAAPVWLGFGGGGAGRPVDG